MGKIADDVRTCEWLLLTFKLEMIKIRPDEPHSTEYNMQCWMLDFKSPYEIWL